MTWLKKVPPPPIINTKSIYFEGKPEETQQMYLSKSVLYEYNKNLSQHKINEQRNDKNFDRTTKSERWGI